MTFPSSSTVKPTFSSLFSLMPWSTALFSLEALPSSTVFPLTEGSSEFEQAASVKISTTAIIIFFIMHSSCASFCHRQMANTMKKLCHLPKRNFFQFCGTLESKKGGIVWKKEMHGRYWNRK